MFTVVNMIILYGDLPTETNRVMLFSVDCCCSESARQNQVNAYASTLLACKYVSAVTNYKQRDSACFSRNTSMIYNMDYAWRNIYASTLPVRKHVYSS